MNWTQLLSEISASGATQKETAEFCDCGQSTISELRLGKIKEPAHSLGQSLIKFHEMRTRTDKPTP
jgi:hypothetical protein